MNADADETGADACVANTDKEADEAVDATTADPNSVLHHDARSVVPNERRAICLSAMARFVLLKLGIPCCCEGSIGQPPKKNDDESSQSSAPHVRYEPMARPSRVGLRVDC